MPYFEAKVSFLYALSVIFLVSIAAAAGYLTESMKGQKAEVLSLEEHCQSNCLVRIAKEVVVAKDCWITSSALFASYGTRGGMAILFGAQR